VITGYVHAFTTSLSFVIVWEAADNWTTTNIAAYLGLAAPAYLPEGLSYSFTAPGPVSHIELVIPLCDIPDSDCGSTFYLATRIQTSGDDSWIQSDTHYIAAAGCCCFDYSSYYVDHATSVLTFTSASLKRFNDDPDAIAATIADLLKITPSSVYIISFEVDDNGFSTVEIGFTDSQTTPSTAAALLASLDPAEFEKVGLAKVTVGGVAAGGSSTPERERSFVTMQSSAMGSISTLLLLLLSGTALVFLLH